MPDIKLSGFADIPTLICGVYYICTVPVGRDRNCGECCDVQALHNIRTSQAHW